MAAANNYIISDELLHTFCEGRKGQKVQFSGGICLRSASLIKNIELLQAKKQRAEIQ